MTLSRYSDKPLYRQLSDLLLSKLGNEYGWGERLPSEAELAAQYDVNRLTVRQALDDLARQGKVDAVQGRGTFVAPPPIRYRVAAGRDASFTRSMAELGHGVESRSLRTTKDPDPEIRTELRTRRSVTRYDFLRLVDDAPWSLSSTWLTPTRFPGIEDHWAGDSSLFGVLERHYGIRMRRAGRTFSAVPAAPVDAEHLMVAVGAPLLVSRGLIVADDGEPIAVSEHRCRGDRVRFSVEFDDIDGLDDLDPAGSDPREGT
ncbi:MAG: GntR family transcriptional regulator [Actinomycetota bacterium]|nr:GntR family transcriptional regulator [Actinomycetota bacterium]